MSKDIDQIAASTPETTNLTGTERIYCGVPTGTPNVSQDGWTTPISLLSYNPGFNRRASAVSIITVVDGDINGAIDCTGTSGSQTVVFPATLTKSGTVLIRRSGSVNVVLSFLAGTTFQSENNFLTINTLYHGVSVTSWGSLTNFWVQGCEA